MSVTPILITLAAAPRYVTISRPRNSTVDMQLQPVAIKPLAPANVVLVPKIEPQDDSDMMDPVDEFLVRGKKRRLDHLSWEEKFQRK